MKIRFTFSLISMVVLLNSCSITTVFKSNEKLMSRQAEANGNSAVLVNKPIVADLNVSMTRQNVISVCTNLDIDNSTMDIGSTGNTGLLQINEINRYKDEAKKRAQFQFMKQFECDYLVDPIYTIDVQGQSNSEIINFTVDLSAFPAKYSKFSQPDSLPKSVMQIAQIDNRSLPLYIASASAERTAASKEVGGFFGLGLSKEIDAASSDKSLVSWNLGFYKAVGLSKPVGLRVEARVVRFGGKSKYYDSWNQVNYEGRSSYTSITTPLMLSFNIKKLNLLFGVMPSLNIASNFVSTPDGYSSSLSEGYDTGLTFGANFKITEKLALGYRFDQFANTGYSCQGLSLSVKFK